MLVDLSCNLGGVEDAAELRTILDTQPFSVPCSQIRQPIVKLEKQNWMFGTYSFLILSTFIELHLFVFPYSRFHVYVLPLNIHFTFVNIMFILASFMNPGTVDKKQVSFDKLVEKCDPNGLCPNCETMFTRDSRHCYFCNQCVHKFDHHCTWINNCVGRRNHCAFFSFISSLLIYFAIMVGLGGANFWKESGLISKKQGYNIFMGYPQGN